MAYAPVYLVILICPLTAGRAIAYLARRKTRMETPSSNPAASPKDALLKELFIIYQETAAAGKKAGDAEDRRALSDIQDGLNRAIKRLSPLEESWSERWQELRAAFRK